MLRRITWLGQAGFRIEIDGVVVVVDPWLSPHEDRLIPAPPLELAAHDVDVLLITHDHLDHLDLPFVPQLLERSPEAKVVVPDPAAARLEELVPESQLIRVQPGDELDVAGLALRVTPAIHGVTPEDGYGDGSEDGGRAQFVGYVLGAEHAIYHAGDTIVTPELVAAVAPLGVETALVPINGRDEAREARGIVGNADAADAVELADAIGAGVLVPIHWDGFAGNTADPRSASDAARGRVRVLIPSHFEAVELEVAQ
jgi:L-ascorbate metabolism protein UlaG (beta-lactamase superfamily)